MGKSFVPLATRPEGRMAPGAKAGSNGVDKSAAADAAWLDVAIDSLHGSLRRRATREEMAPVAARMPIRMAASFKGGPRGGGGANDAEAVADSDFAVGAQIDQRDEIVALCHAGGDDSGKDVGADKAAKAGREANCAGCRQMPAEILRAECLRAKIR